ncbi:MAG: hypothetical protein U0263_20260 [Polyangiaceae bacterium]
MREPKCNRGLRPAVSLSAALAVHALVAWVAWRIPVPPAAVQAIPDVAVEFALLAPPLVPEPPPTPASGTPAVASLRASEIGRGTRTDSPAHGEPTPEIGEVLDAPDGSAPAIPAPPAPKVELGLDGAVVNRFLLEGRKPETRRQARARASLMLREELDALDAAKGVGRSSTALRAAERASSSAPLLGSATFVVSAVKRMVRVLPASTHQLACCWWHLLEHRCKLACLRIAAEALGSLDRINAIGAAGRHRPTSAQAQARRRSTNSSSNEGLGGRVDTRELRERGARADARRGLRLPAEIRRNPRRPVARASALTARYAIGASSSRSSEVIGGHQ